MATDVNSRAQNEAKGHLGPVFLGLMLSLCAALPNEANAEGPKVETLPASRGGQDIVGSTLPPLTFDRWLRDTSDAKKPNEPNAPRVTLYRWWTDGCPFCERTLPAIESLRNKYEKQGLRVVAVFHTKPPGPLKDETILKAADRIGYAGPIAVDPEWAVLKKVYLDRSDRRATSVSLLVDEKAVIRFVHPGVQFFPSDDPQCAQEDADFKLLERAIVTLLAK
jgi:thiol-disulfide isomerase/thioredoxin